MSDGNGRGGWELTKENIQPLSCGRRMADLSGALPTRAATFTDQMQYEEHHLKEIEKLEGLASQKLGDDPLQGWCNVISYLLQHFPNMGHNIKAKYGSVLQKAFREFHGDKKYLNDERYVKIVVTNMKKLPPVDQIKMISGFLNSGLGELVSDVYIRLAELYDGLGDTKKASDILKQGIEKNAQPKEKLQELLTHIQESWAKNYAKLLQSNFYSFKPGEEDSDGSRHFASSVPIVGENNEAVSIRQNLLPSAPTNTSRSTKMTSNPRQNTMPQKLSVFNEENSCPPERLVSNDNPASRTVDLERLESISSAESDRENRLDACRWNSKDTHLENPIIPEPPEKMKLFVEEALPSAAAASSSINKSRALMERKEDSEPELDTLPTFQASSALQNSSKDAPVKVAEAPLKDMEIVSSSSSSEVKISKKEGDTNKAESFVWRPYNYCKDGGRDNFFENVEYKPLPPGRKVSRIMLQCEQYLAAREKHIKLKEQEKNEVFLLQKQVNHLKTQNEDLLKEIDQLKSQTSAVPQLERMLKEQKQQSDVKLFEKEEKIALLESNNEQLMGQLTKATTTINMKDTQMLNLLCEKMGLEQEVNDVRRDLENVRRCLEEERQRHQDEIQLYKRKCDQLSQQESIIKKRIKQEKFDVENDYEKERSNIRPKQSFVDIEVRSQTTTDIYSSSSPSTTSTDHGASENSRFNSGDTTVEQQLSVAASSFMPDLGDIDDKSLMMMSMEVPASIPRKAFGMVERHLSKDMMNITPAAPPPVDFEIPAPSFGGNFRKPSRMFNLYESISDSMSKPSREIFNPPPAAKRADFVRNIQCLPENQPPTKLPVPTFNSQENTPSIVSERAAEILSTEEPFRRPALPVPSNPSDENASGGTTLRKPRRSMILAGHRLGHAQQQGEGDSSDEEDEVILRRHHQTGMDLNISNLTCALALAPKPLTNSTPEREKTFRDLPIIPPRNLALASHHHHQPQETEDPPMSESQIAPASRFSILNEPPLNLSTIQETSRENRSRSTTGSSSGGCTMSSTRFGTASSSTSTHLSGNITARSASVPRSASRSISHNNNNNGYHSDTNPMQ